LLGLGTAASPFIIETPDDFNAVRNNLTAYYELANDIDMTGFVNFLQIGTSNTIAFSGRFDGKGRKVSNLSIKNTASFTSPFGVPSGCRNSKYFHEPKMNERIFS